MTKLMEVETGRKAPTKRRGSFYSINLIIFVFVLFFLVILFHSETSPLDSSFSPSTTSWAFFNRWKGLALSHSNLTDTLISELRESVTFLPLKDLRFSKTAMTWNTWFMSSLNDTIEENEAEYLYFPSKASKGRLLCIKSHDTRDGTRNSYALAWPESLPNSTMFMKGLTFVSDSYYDYVNLWHEVCAMAPFVGWSMKNECLRPKRWVLFHWGELRNSMGQWLQSLMQANFGEVLVEGFEKGDGPYCFEKAIVMRHNVGNMGKEKRLQVFDLLRCKARGFCGINKEGRGREVNERGEPIIRLTLLMRKGSRSFKNATAVIDIFARECARVKGCLLKVVQSEDLTFCDQVKVMSNTDIVASPHGAQLTNMLFMDRNSSIMEFFPKGWLELAGIGQYAHHWMADLSRMKHQGAWWDPNGEKECPFPKEDPECFTFYKDGKVGHNETFFSGGQDVVNQVRISKLEQATQSTPLKSSACIC